MNNRALVEQIVFEVLKRLPLSAPNMAAIGDSRKNVLVYAKKQEKYASSLGSLQGTCTIMVKSVDEEAEDIPANVDEVVFLEGTQDLLVKGAIGITDTPETSRLAFHLIKGTRVSIVPTEYLKQIIYEDERKVVNNAYLSLLLQYKQILEEFGVTIESFSQFEKRQLHKQEKKEVVEAVTFKGKLLMEKDVQQHENEEITVLPSTIITPLARDAARDLRKNIKVIDVKGAD